MTTEADDGPNWRRLGTLVALALFGIVLIVFIASAVPQLVGADHSYVVLSDSMSPEINAGALVFVGEVSPDSIQTGDVITYVDRSRGESRRVTHRVVGIETQDGQRAFRTKGDANEEADPGLVAASSVIGAVQFHLPLVGYAINIARSPLGLIALVVIPAILLIATELRDLYSAAASDDEDEATETEATE